MSLYASVALLKSPLAIGLFFFPIILAVVLVRTRVAEKAIGRH